MSYENHKINENSVFFQGHINQYFTKSGISFKIYSNFGEDINGSEEINYNSFRNLFSKEINKRINLRNEGGGNLDQISTDEIKIKKIKLTTEQEEICGRYMVHPRLAMCTEDGCNTLFELNKGRNCKHTKNDSSEQLKFLGICDVCGRTLPINYITNIGNKCKNCHSEGSLLRLHWEKKDKIGSYEVGCINCGKRYNLSFIYCNHKKNQLSDKPSKKFRAITVRKNSICHPIVLTMPYLSKNKTINSRFSNAFDKIFKSDCSESLIYLDHFLEKLDTSNWDENIDIKYILEREFPNNKNHFDELCHKDRAYIIKRLINSSVEYYESPNNSNMTLSELKDSRQYLVDIEDTLEKIGDLEFTEKDRQGIFLDESNISQKKILKTPNSYNKNNWAHFLKNSKLEKIYLFKGIKMVQALIGTVTGSSRKKYPLFDPLKNRNNKKYNVFTRSFDTEALFFKLKPKEVSKWLIKNGYIHNYDNKHDLKKFLLYNSDAKSEVYKLLHTLSHMLIQESTKSTGLDSRSLSEEIFPLSTGIYIYSTNTVNTGGLELTYNSDIDLWVKRSYELAKHCPQDPACMKHEKGSCISCSFLPEFVCINFNQELDRSTLIGGDRYNKYL